MVGSFFVLSCLLTAVLVAGIIYLMRVKHEMSRAIRFLFATAGITIMCNAVAVVTKSEFTATLFHGLYFAATDWLVIVLLLYARKYTGLYKDEKIVLCLICAGSVIDTVSMAANSFTHHVFISELADVFGRGECFVIAPKRPMYTFHLLYVYAMVLIVLCILIMKTMQTIKLYRKKYEMIVWSFICILAVNIGYRFIEGLPIDLSPIFYMGLAVAVGYFTLFYVPKGIVAKLLSFSIEDMESGILCFDMDGKCVYANTVARELLGAETDMARTEAFFTEWKAGRENSELAECSWQDRRVTESGTAYYETKFKPLLDSDGNYIGGFFSIENRTEEIRKLERERFRATHDSLTGIYNREQFFESVRSCIDKNPEKERYMLCSDIKDFKIINELFGNDTGDEILRQTAWIIQKEATEDTIYGRLGSDRFAMCMNAENFHENVFVGYVKQLSNLAKNSVYHMHMHVGVYRITDPSMEVSVMCDRAFVAIGHIKGNYQQIVTYYDDNLGTALANEMTMIGEFDQAVAENQFHMFLQPQISVEEKLLGAEALVRWIHPQKGMIPPGDFIPVFERCGYIHRLDMCIWEIACRQLKQWKEQGHGDLHISVNISPKDFYYINIYEAFTRLVESYGIDPKKLKLEITETALMTELNQQMDLLYKLRNYGFEIEIDDFGSGYSSLNTLKDIEVDVLKLDMGFLRKTEHEEKGVTIMNAVISMSKQLGLTVVTEGVETAEQVEYLKKANCDIFQGYYFARPMPVAEFEERYFQAQI